MELCRLCFTKGEHLNIFSENGGDLSMIEIISDHFKCEVSEMDCLPKCVCGKCWELTETFHKFYKSVKSAQCEYLAKWVKSESDGMSNNELTQRSFLKTNFVECQTSGFVECLISGNMKMDETLIDESNLDINIDDLASVKGDQMERLKSENSTGDMTEYDNDENSVSDKIVERGTSISIRRKQKKRRRTKEEKENRNANIEKLMAENIHRFDMNCDECTVHFESFEDARKHYLSAHNNPKGYIKCCKAKLKYPCEIVNHINFHLNPDQHKCDLCGRAYTRKELLTAHMKKHTSIEPKIKQQFTCDICNKILTTESGLRVHKKGHEDKRKTGIKVHKQFMAEHFDMSCDLCPIKFDSFWNARAHYKGIHDINDGYIKCCNTKFARLWAVNDHIDYHLNPENYKCHVCDKIFAGKIAFREHSRRHAAKESRPFMCDICSKRYPGKSTLQNHILTVHVQHELNFECELCGKRFTMKRRLKAHILLVHRSVAEICEVCGKSFKTKYKLQAHLLTHNESKGSRPLLQCTFCGDWLRTPRGIREHKDKHTSGPQQCSQCDTVLSNSKALETHIRYHHMERKHKCNFCGKSYVTPSRLQEHIDSHTGQGSYPCKYCSMVFRARASLVTHRFRTHSIEWKRDQAMKKNSIHLEVS